MKIKILVPNNQGKLEFDKEELEKLLEESYNEGFEEGFEEGRKFNNNLAYQPYYYSLDNKITCSKNSSPSVLSSSSVLNLADNNTIELINGEKENGISNQCKNL